MDFVHSPGHVGVSAPVSTTQADDCKQILYLKEQHRTTKTGPRVFPGIKQHQRLLREVLVKIWSLMAESACLVRGSIVCDENAWSV